MMRSTLKGKKAGTGVDYKKSAGTNEIMNSISRESSLRPSLLIDFITLDAKKI